MNCESMLADICIIRAGWLSVLCIWMLYTHAQNSILLWFNHNSSYIDELLVWWKKRLKIYFLNICNAVKIFFCWSANFIRNDDKSCSRLSSYEVFVQVTTSVGNFVECCILNQMKQTIWIWNDGKSFVLKKL